MAGPGTAVVFGASGNVGRSAALGFLTAGYRVLAVSRREAGLAKLKSLVAAAPGADAARLVPVEADIATPSGREAVLGAIDADGAPPLAAVVSSFGPWVVTPPMSETPADTYAGLWESNLHPHFHAWQVLAPRMAAAGEGASYTIVTGSAGEAPAATGLVGVAAAALFALAQWAMAEGKGWGGAGAAVTELRISVRVEDDEVVDAGKAAEGDDLKRASTFAPVFPTLVAAGSRGETVKLTGAEFKKLLAWAVERGCGGAGGGEGGRALPGGASPVGACICEVWGTDAPAWQAGQAQREKQKLYNVLVCQLPSRREETAGGRPIRIKK